MSSIASLARDSSALSSSNATRYVPKCRSPTSSTHRECAARPKWDSPRPCEGSTRAIPCSHTFFPRGPMPREPPPIQLETRSVPAKHSLRLDEDQRPIPSRPKPSQDHPEEFVRNTKPRLRTATHQDRKLLPQGQVFKKEMTARTNRPDEESEQEAQNTQHGWVIPKKTWWRSRQMRLGRPAGSPPLFTVKNRPHPAQIIQFYIQTAKLDLLLIWVI